MKSIKQNESDSGQTFTRRSLFKGLGAGVTLGAFSSPAVSGLGENTQSRGVKRGRINQSVVSWCFANHWSVDETVGRLKIGLQKCRIAFIETLGKLKKYGLTCAISGIPVEGKPFIKGFNNPDYHDWLVKATKQAIEESSEFGCPNVIAFTG